MIKLECLVFLFFHGGGVDLKTIPTIYDQETFICIYNIKMQHKFSRLYRCLNLKVSSPPPTTLPAIFHSQKMLSTVFHENIPGTTIKVLLLLSFNIGLKL